MFAMMMSSGSPDEYFLVCSKEGHVVVEDSQEVMVKEIEDTYMEYHGRGLESSGSATMSWMTFRPTIIKIPDSIEETGALLEGKLYTLRSMAGMYYGWKIKKEAIQALIESSMTPRLIVGEGEEIKP